MLENLTIEILEEISKNLSEKDLACLAVLNKKLYALYIGSKVMNLTRSIPNYKVLHNTPMIKQLVKCLKYSKRQPSSITFYETEDIDLVAKICKKYAGSVKEVHFVKPWSDFYTRSVDVSTLVKKIKSQPKMQNIAFFMDSLSAHIDHSISSMTPFHEVVGCKQLKHNYIYFDVGEFWSQAVRDFESDDDAPLMLNPWISKFAAGAKHLVLNNEVIHQNVMEDEHMPMQQLLECFASRLAVIEDRKLTIFEPFNDDYEFNSISVFHWLNTLCEKKLVKTLELVWKCARSQDSNLFVPHLFSFGRRVPASHASVEDLVLANRDWRTLEHTCNAHGVQLVVRELWRRDDGLYAPLARV